MGDAGAAHRSDPDYLAGYAAVAAAVSRYTGIGNGDIDIGTADIIPESITGYRWRIYIGPHSVDQVIYGEIDIGLVAGTPVRYLGIEAAAGVGIYYGQLPAVIEPGPPDRPEAEPGMEEGIVGGNRLADAVEIAGGQCLPDLYTQLWEAGCVLHLLFFHGGGAEKAFSLPGAGSGGINGKGGRIGYGYREFDYFLWVEDRLGYFGDDVIGYTINPIPDGIDIVDGYPGFTDGTVFPGIVDGEPFGNFARYTTGTERPEL
jgi:hypothetical protein